MNLNQNSAKQIVIKFFALWVTLSTSYYIALAVATDALPSRVNWITDWVMPTSILVALGAALIATSHGRQVRTINQVVKHGAKIGAYGAGLIIVIFVLSVLLSPRDTISSGELLQALNDAPLTPAQKQEIIKVLEKQHYISEDELKGMGLNDIQIQQTIEIVKNELSKVTPTPTLSDAELVSNTSCYIEPKAGYTTVTIRQEPDTHYHNAIGYLARGEKVKVTGYAIINNQEGWWRVEINHGLNPVQGWVRDWPVAVNDQVQCNNVPRIIP